MGKSAKELLAELQSGLPKVREVLPHVHEAFGTQLAPSVLTDGALSKKLMALAIAVRITCDCRALRHQAVSGGKGGPMRKSPRRGRWRS